MKKIVCLLLCMVVMLNLAMGVSAEETASDPTNQTEHTHSWTITDTATCTEAGTITKTCSCGETQTEASPAKGHQWDAGVENPQATCQQAGVKTFTCTVCTATKTEDVPKLSHSYGAWTTDANTHSRVCSLCNTTEAGNHSWKDEVTKVPTCKETGIRRRYCTVCNYEILTELPKESTHTYDSACDPECNVCGYKRTVSHSFTTTWSRDSKEHWHECSKCGEKKDVAKHIAGPAATEEKDQVCTACGYVITQKKPHTHSYGTEWTSDEVGHWHACTKCTDEKDYASHKYDDDCDGECNVCGYQRKNSHAYDETWQTSAFEHWQVCTACQEESKHEKHVPGPEATDEEAQLCSICGYELAPKTEHTHDFSGPWHQDPENHWRDCGCGESSVPEKHIWDEGRKNQNKTMTFTCQLCGAEKTETAASSGFPWLIVLLSLLALGCLGGIVVLVVMLKRGVLDDGDEDASEDLQEDSGDLLEDDFETLPDHDPEEKMIDDYFASLDQETYK